MRLPWSVNDREKEVRAGYLAAARRHVDGQMRARARARYLSLDLHVYDRMNVAKSNAGPAVIDELMEGADRSRDYRLGQSVQSRGGLAHTQRTRSIEW
jgi:hypothetical protein